MKTTLLLLLLLTTSLSAIAQENIEYDKLPDPVKRFFPSVYPLHDRIEVLWTFEDSLFIARFNDAGYPVEVMFKENGYWVNTFLYIDYSYAPESVSQYVEEHYPNHWVIKCAISNNALNERFYIVTILDSANQAAEIKFTLNGKFSQ